MRDSLNWLFQDWRPSDSLRARRGFQAEPLKAHSRIAVHRLHFYAVERNGLVIRCEFLNPPRIVVTHCRALGQVEYTVSSMPRLVTSISRGVTGVCLEHQVADVEKTARSQDAI